MQPFFSTKYRNLQFYQFKFIRRTNGFLQFETASAHMQPGSNGSSCRYMIDIRNNSDRIDLENTLNHQLNFLYCSGISVIFICLERLNVTLNKGDVNQFEFLKLPYLMTHLNYRCQGNVLCDDSQFLVKTKEHLLPM